MKMGQNSNDNGFLRLRKVRIPRDQMLSRYSHVDKDGNFEIIGDMRLLYTAMSGTRVIVMLACFHSLMRATMVATRYAVCRRQFRNEEGTKRERKLIDYQTHLAVIGPSLAAKFMFILAAKRVKDITDQAQKDAEQGDFSKLELMHHLTSGFKAYMT
jgi:acyl-CoA oxidase